MQQNITRDEKIARIIQANYDLFAPLILINAWARTNKIVFDFIWFVGAAFTSVLILIGNSLV